jgi:flavin-dependent dehydrogenase
MTGLSPVQLFSQSALQLVDDALMSAAQAGTKASKEADEAFKEAVNMLSDYERKYHSEFEETVSRRMEKAEKEDKSSLKVLNRLKETFRVREELSIP